jgi:serine/threonine-protein kinase
MTDLLDRLKTALADRYRIKHEIGSGGMATVYLAHDLKHDRKVAVKVLKPELAAVLGAERFVQEIKTTASLQHPHILPLFDSGEADGFLYYVMPFIEGETLREKLNRETQLGVEEAVRITREVSDALDYAHRNNVIHRDIKPENILLHDGRPMVADFGIALAVSAAAGGRMTETGLSLGTPHYMSPEQAVAEKDLTNRSDVYSLGCVLYEMLTGEPPHTGASAQAIVMKIVTDEARPVTELRKSVPPNVAAALATSLEKLPADRFESAARFADALTNTAFAVHSTVTRGIGSDPRTPRRWVTAAVLGGLAFLAVWGWLPQPGIGPAPVARYVAVAETELLDGAPMLFPDGSAFLFVARVGTGSRGAEASGILAAGSRRLYRRDIGTLETSPLPETAGLTDAAVSPDGTRIAFTRGGRLYHMPIEGGPATPIGGSLPTLGRGITWLAQDTVAVASTSGVSVVGLGGRMPVAYGGVDTSRTRVLWPSALPGGRGVLVTLATGAIEESQVALLTRDASEPRVLVERGTDARYLPTGHIVLARSDGSLHAVEFDLKGLEAAGLAVPILTGVAVDETGRAHFSTADDGTLLYMTATEPARTVVLVNRRGGEQQVTRDPRLYSEPRFSPDGQHIAVAVLDGNTRDIWIWDIEQTTLSRLTHGGTDRYPQWSPDGQWIAFASYRDGPAGLFVRAANGDGEARVLDAGGYGRFPSSWTTDGRRVVAQVMREDGTRDLVTFPVDSAEDASVYLRESWEEFSADISPDGRSVAYVSDESGRLEVYVRGFPGAEHRTQVSRNGATEPRWSPTGREVFYRTVDGWFVAAAIRADSAITVHDRANLFRDEYVRRDWITSYDVHPDGDRFLFVRTVEDDEPDLMLADRGRSELVVVINFFEELKVKVGS